MDESHEPEAFHSDPLEVIDEYALVDVPKTTKATNLAFLFMEAHFDVFAIAEEKGGMAPIARHRFDEWCVAAGELSSCPEDHSSGSDIRIGLVQRRNYIRTTINSAAIFGRHGWPPYEIAAEGDEYVIKLIEPLLRTITYEVAERIGGLIDNKMAFVKKLGEEMATDERLPEDLRQDWRTQERMLKQAANACAFHVAEYLKEFNVQYHKVQRYLARRDGE
jgi:hypothetical protein